MDDTLQGWPYEPEPGEVIAREVRARDGRTVIQVRVELGVLQMEIGGRPDGLKPHGFATYLEYLRYRAAGKGNAKSSRASAWTMSTEHCTAADRELMQFHHRRLAWLTLQRYDKALLDAEHTLAMMDFIAEHSNDAEYIASHERLRPLVLFHRTQALAALALERRKPEEAVDIVREGIDRLTTPPRHDADEDEDEDEAESGESPNQPLIEQLRILEQDIRKNFSVQKTLKEQLDEAVADEDYERAAKLRDQIRARARR
ncbi:UvrB/UvrC motif-containing protein [Singulisphaera sp. PoT]|uniref:UvrB/UvrC motif-containing protein n=1 Tax=Singulisphaera sp. PoT TaxID=3411797 RepID=UPI003BF5B863